MVTQKWTHRQTDKWTQQRTFRLIKSIGPVGQCFENIYFCKFATFPWLSLLFPWLSMACPWLYVSSPRMSLVGEASKKSAALIWVFFHKGGGGFGRNWKVWGPFFGIYLLEFLGRTRESQPNQKVLGTFPPKFLVNNDTKSAQTVPKNISIRKVPQKFQKFLQGEGWTWFGK